MAHDVFICYASVEKPIADAVCAKLEAARIRCWIAPRDVLGGQEYAKTIVDAIHNAKLMLLVFSTAANTSSQVRREIDRAVSQGLPILPLRVENVVPSAALEYYLAGQHWLDAISPPLEDHLDRLVEAISVLLRPAAGEVPTTPPVVPPPVVPPTVEPPPVVPPPQGPQRRSFLTTPKVLAAVAVVIVVLAIVAVVVLRAGGTDKTTPRPAATGAATSPTPTTTPVSTPTPGDTVVGDHWQIKVTDVAAAGNFSAWSNTNRSYQYIILTVEVTYVGPGNAGTYSPQAVQLMNTGAVDEGWSKKADFCKGEASSKITYLEEAQSLLSIEKGVTRTETIVWDFPKSYHHFLLYFPETQAIAISV